MYTHMYTYVYIYVTYRCLLVCCLFVCSYNFIHKYVFVVHSVSRPPTQTHPTWNPLRPLKLA